MTDQPATDRFSAEIVGVLRDRLRSTDFLFGRTDDYVVAIKDWARGQVVWEHSWGHKRRQAIAELQRVNDELTAMSSREFIERYSLRG